MEQIKLKGKFRLSKSNWTYYIFYVVVFELTKLIRVNDFASGMGGFTAGVGISLGISTLLSWVLWLILNKRKKVAIITFNIILTFFVILAINKCNTLQEQKTEIERLESKLLRLKEQITKTDKSANNDSILSDYILDVKNTFAKLAEKSDGEEKLFFIKMIEFITEKEKYTWEYSKAFDSLYYWRMFNLVLLNNHDEYNHQRNVIRYYIEKTTAMHNSFHNYQRDIEQYLIDINDQNELKKGVLQGTGERCSNQQHIINSYFYVSLEHGKSLIEYLDILEGNMNKWEYIDGVIITEDTNLQFRINQVCDKIALSETAIDSLWLQLIKVL